MGWWRPREVSRPARLSHSRGRCHSAAKVSASRTYFITRRHGEGLWAGGELAFKSFLPRFFTKKRAGSRGGAHGRAPQRAERPLCFTKRRRGSKGEPSPGVPPLRAAPAARSLAQHRSVGGYPTPGGGGTPPLQRCFRYERGTPAGGPPLTSYRAFRKNRAINIRPRRAAITRRRRSRRRGARCRRRGRRCRRAR